jgi:hypothetical protein
VNVHNIGRCYFKKVLQSFCAGAASVGEYIKILQIMLACDRRLLQDVCEFKYIGSWGSLGYTFHLRSLTDEEGKAESVREEMERLVGRERKPGGGKLHTYRSAFRQVVTKHFAPRKGAFLNILTVVRLSTTGSTVFIK